LLLGAVVTKIIPMLVFRLNFSWRETLAAAALLSARLSLIIAASAIGLRIGVISESVNAAIILVAIIAVTLAPILFVRFLPKYETSKQRPILVAGAGHLGLLVAEQLRGHGETVIVVDSDQARLARAHARGFETGFLDLDHADLGPAAYWERIEAIVCTFLDTELNFRLCQVARATYGIAQVIAQVNKPAEIARFEQIGVKTMNPAIDRAALLVLLTRNPATYDLLIRTDDDKEVQEVVITNGEVVGKALRQIQLPGDVLVVAMQREGELLMPHGNTQLTAGDRLTLAGSIDAVALVREMFEVQP
jgi:Trk K+ transport system NAD-binding subunit